MSHPVCPGVVVTSVDGAAICHDANGQPAVWTTVPVFDISQLDPAMLSGAFAAGFVLVGTAFVIGKGVSIILSMLK